MPSGWVHKVFIDGNNKWTGGSFGVSKFDGTNWTNFNNTNSGIVGSEVFDITKDGQGNFWFATDRGVSKFDGSTWNNYNTYNSGLIDSNVRAVAIDNQGNKWFGTANGVSKFDGFNWNSYTTSDGLGGNWVNSIAIDQQGNKWFGFGTGLSVFTGSNWSTYHNYQIGVYNNSNIHQIVCESNGTTWIATSHGLVECNNFSFINHSAYNSGLGYLSARAIAIDGQNNKWISTTDTWGYANGFSVLSSSTTSATILSLNEKFLIYPNPVSDNVFIQPSNEISFDNIAIYDLLGNIVFSSNNFSSTKVNVSDLTAGSYFIDLRNGSSVSRAKFVKQ